MKPTPHEMWRVLVEAAEGAADSERIDRDDWVQLRTPSSPFATANKLFLARLSPADADARIAEVVDDHRRRGASLRWVVDPQSEPADLPQRLVAAGFDAPVETWGMVRSVHGDLPTVPIGTHIRAATPDDDELIASIGMRAWNPSPAFGASLRDVLRRTRDRQDVHYAIASLDGQLAGWSTLRLLPPLGYFQGACVLPEFRGRGVYRALVVHRLRQLGHLELDAGVIWASAHSSGPIAQSLGFEEVTRAQFLEFHPAKHG